MTPKEALKYIDLAVMVNVAFIWEHITTEEAALHMAELARDMAKAQEAKRQAFIEAGGAILNPDALTELYEALRAVDDYLSANYPRNIKLKQIAADKLISALALAEA